MSNYDITFCEGDGCQHKEQCYRYCELLRYRADNDPKISVSLTVLRRKPKPSPSQQSKLKQAGRQQSTNFAT